MNGPFVKQCIRINGQGNNYLGDAVVGGQITAAPSGLSVSAWQQTLPGDRMILNDLDALLWSDTTNVGTLYGGLFVYVRTPVGATLTPTLGHVSFWDSTVAGSLCQVTPDENVDAEGVSLFAGVFISTLTKGYSWWIQKAGRINCVFRAVLTGVPAAGCPVYVAADTLGKVDVLDSGGNPTFTQIGQMLQRYMGTAIGIPVAGATSVVDVPLGGLFRW